MRFEELLKHRKSAKKSILIALAIIAVIASAAALASITLNVSVPSSGTVTAGPNIGVYSNSACTSAVTSINWGSIEAGGSTSQTIYIEDTGTAQMAPSISVGDWSPSSASSYVTIAWSTLPAEIQPGVSGAIAVTLTCSVVAGTPAETFSNTITISGTG